MIQFQKSDIQKRMKKPDNKLTLQKKMILMIAIMWGFSIVLLAISILIGVV